MFYKLYAYCKSNQISNLIKCALNSIISVPTLNWAFTEITPWGNQDFWSELLFHVRPSDFEVNSRLNICSSNLMRLSYYIRLVFGKKLSSNVGIEPWFLLTMRRSLNPSTRALIISHISFQAHSQLDYELGKDKFGKIINLRIHLRWAKWTKYISLTNYLKLFILFVPLN